MKSLAEVGKERNDLETVAELTRAFEGIASMHIAAIKDQVLNSQVFFRELWEIYSQIRVDTNFHFGRSTTLPISSKELIVLLTAEGSFSSELDRQVVDVVKDIYDPNKNDIIVVGTHGAAFLSKQGISYKRSFKAPLSDKYINVNPLVTEIQKYKSTVVLYPAYISLTTQEIKSIKMSALVQERGKNIVEKKEVISEANYIFEPSTFAVVDHLERTMIVIMLGEIILEAKLAQYASRFRAMNAAKDKANEAYQEVAARYNHLKRLIKDERAKEVLNGLRKTRQ